MRLPRDLSGRDLARALQPFGYEITRQKGSHLRLTRTTAADQPYPSYLRLGWIGDRALHVVAADNAEEQETIVITVYEPDPQRWEPGFTQRRR